jgi:general stress protein YciG
LLYINLNKGEYIMAIQDRGFASMDENKQKDIASKGGKASSTRNSNMRSSNASSRAGGVAGSTEAAKKGGENSRRII